MWAAKVLFLTHLTKLSSPVSSLPHNVSSLKALRGSVEVGDHGDLGRSDVPDGAEWLGPSKLVFTGLIGDDELNQQLAELVLNLKNSQETRLVSNKGGWHSAKNMHRQGFVPLLNLKRVLEPLVLCLFDRGIVEPPEDAQGPPSFTIAELWANVLGPGDSNIWHTHCKRCRSSPGAAPGVSGVYYVSVGNSGPSPLQLRDEPFQGSGKTSFIEVVPHAGQAVVFPAWMEHAVAPHRNVTQNNGSMGPRISIAFNLVPRWFSSHAQRAAFLGESKRVVELLQTDGDGSVHIVDSRGLSLLHRAAEGGHMEVAKLLMERRAKVSVPAADGRQPIHWASEAGHTKFVQLLLDRHANITAEAPGAGGQPIHTAARLGNLELVEFLLDARAEARAKGGDGSSEPLHLAAATGGVTVVETLLKARAGVGALQSPDGKGWLPLHHAAFKGNTDITQLLLAARADATAPVLGRHGNGNLPIHLAAQRGSISTLETLIHAPLTSEFHREEGWHCVRGAAGQLPLEVAKKQGHEQVVQWFSQQGAATCY
eukprot:gnl/MRDRNA2_/MRDRNA2_105028_c0_seq1.p1 gnl/MRDRNA2_/MRDRNA2_105028_c0~~gnl/MRDRNA2_/MRDRNA2_105028_c0_seq1.p1  ORF type:complete len:539 (+),score=111.05 gnl/MRDRNA2_/MRDRNA2_105028_c0_seq1:176-1792(+)